MESKNVTIHYQSCPGIDPKKSTTIPESQFLEERYQYYQIGNIIVPAEQEHLEPFRNIEIREDYAKELKKFFEAIGIEMDHVHPISHEFFQTLQKRAAQIQSQPDIDNNLNIAEFKEKISKWLTEKEQLIMRILNKASHIVNDQEIISEVQKAITTLQKYPSENTNILARFQAIEFAESISIKAGKELHSSRNMTSSLSEEEIDIYLRIKLKKEEFAIPDDINEMLTATGKDLSIEEILRYAAKQKDKITTQQAFDSILKLLGSNKLICDLYEKEHANVSTEKNAPSKNHPYLQQEVSNIVTSQELSLEEKIEQIRKIFNEIKRLTTTHVTREKRAIISQRTQANWQKSSATLQQWDTWLTHTESKFKKEYTKLLDAIINSNSFYIVGNDHWTLKYDSPYDSKSFLATFDAEISDCTLQQFPTIFVNGSLTLKNIKGLQSIPFHVFYTNSLEIENCPDLISVYASGENGINTVIPGQLRRIAGKAWQEATTIHVKATNCPNLTRIDNHLACTKGEIDYFKYSYPDSVKKAPEQIQEPLDEFSPWNNSNPTSDKQMFIHINNCPKFQPSPNQSNK